MSDLNGGEGKYLYSYSIRMSLLPEGCMLDDTYYNSCQLYSRHWIIRAKDDVVSDVNAEAVIGKVSLPYFYVFHLCRDTIEDLHRGLSLHAIRFGLCKPLSCLSLS